MANPTQKSNPVKFIIAAVIILGTIAYLSFSGGRDSKDYYVTIGKMRKMGDVAYTRHLRVGGFVVPGSIQRSGPHATFQLTEQAAGNTFPECKDGGPDCVITINYTGQEPPPDTFKDNAQALAVGTYGRDGVFHANELQAKCASKYAPVTPAATPTTTATALPITH